MVKFRHYTTLEVKEEYRGNFDLLIGKDAECNLVSKNIPSLSGALFFPKGISPIVRYDGLNEHALNLARDSRMKNYDSPSPFLINLKMDLLENPDNSVAKVRDTTKRL